MIKVNHYEDNLWYPMVVGHRIVEMQGKDINSYNSDRHINVSVSMWESMNSRIEKLEKELYELKAKKTI